MVMTEEMANDEMKAGETKVTKQRRRDEGDETVFSILWGTIQIVQLLLCTT